MEQEYQSLNYGTGMPKLKRDHNNLVLSYDNAPSAKKVVALISFMECSVLEDRCGFSVSFKYLIATQEMKVFSVLLFLTMPFNGVDWKFFTNCSIAWIVQVNMPLQYCQLKSQLIFF